MSIATLNGRHSRAASLAPSTHSTVSVATTFAPFLQPAKLGARIDAPAFNPVSFGLPTRFNGNQANVPKCGPNPRDVRRFLEDMEELGGQHTMSDRQMIEMALYYGTLDQRLVWKTVPGASGQDWLMFKAEVLQIYPDAFFEGRDLHLFSEERAKMRIASEGDLRKYYAAYLIIANDLEDQGRMGRKQLATYFGRGLHPEIGTLYRQTISALEVQKDHRLECHKFHFDCALSIVRQLRTVGQNRVAPVLSELGRASPS